VLELDVRTDVEHRPTELRLDVRVLLEAARHDRDGQ